LAFLGRGDQLVQVTGSAGTADFCDSAPVGATVISVPGPVGLAAAGAGPAAGVWLVMTRRMPPSGTAVQGPAAHRRWVRGPRGPPTAPPPDISRNLVMITPVSSRFP